MAAAAAVATRSRASMELLEARRPCFPAGLRVLLLEGVPERPATLRLLREHCYEPVCAEDTAHAVALLNGGDLDVVLADIAAAGSDLQQLADAAAAAGVPLVVAGSRCGPAQLLAVESAAAYLERPLSKLCIRNLWQHTVRSLLHSASPQPGALAAAAPAPAAEPDTAEPSSSGGGGSSSQQRPARRKAKRGSSSGCAGSKQPSNAAAAEGAGLGPPSVTQQEAQPAQEQQPQPQPQQQQPASPRLADSGAGAAADAATAGGAGADCLAVLALPPLGPSSIAFDPDTILLDLHLDASQPDQLSLDDLLCCPEEEDSGSAEQYLLLGGCSSGAASGDTRLQELESADVTSAAGMPSYISMTSVQSPFSRRAGAGAGLSAPIPPSSAAAAAAAPALAAPAPGCPVMPQLALPAAWAAWGAPPPAARGMVWGMPLHTVATVPGLVVQPAAAAAAAAAGSTSASMQAAASAAATAAQAVAAPVPAAPAGWWPCMPPMLPQPAPAAAAPGSSSGHHMMLPYYAAWPGMAAMYAGSFAAHMPLAAGGMAAWLPAANCMQAPVVQPAAPAVQPAAPAAAQQQTAAKAPSAGASGEAGASAMCRAGSLASSDDVFSTPQLCSSSSDTTPTCSGGLLSDGALGCSGLVC